MAGRLINWIKRLMTKPERHDELLKFSLFKGLNHHELLLMHDILHKREFRAGDTVFDAGNPLEVIYLIAEGEIQIEGLPGQKTRTLKKNSVIGIIDMFSQEKRLGSARAVTDLVLLALPRADLREIMAQDPPLAVKLLESCCHLLSRNILDRG